MQALLAIAAGGAVGAVLRFLIATRLQPATLSGFPLGTFTVNAVGSLLLGLLYVVFAEKIAVSDELRLGLTVGLLGAFTTFSTFSLETFRLLEQGRVVVAASYIGSSVVICVLAAGLGILIAKQL